MASDMSAPRALDPEAVRALSNRTGAAFRPRPLAALAEGGFRPRAPLPDRTPEAATPPAPDAPPPDPLPAPEVGPVAPPPLTEAEAERRAAAARAEGFAAGRAEAKADFDAARTAFLAAVAGMEAAADTLLRGIEAELHAAVLRIAAERAGQAIDAAPGPFADRIRGLADRAGAGLETLTVMLCPEDAAAVAPHLPEAARIEPDDTLSRGDVRLTSGRLRIDDRLMREAAE